MNQKEVSELRRRFKTEKSAISRVYGCLVGASGQILSDLNESLGVMPMEEAEQYLSHLKKALSGQLGRNLMDIRFTTRQVVDSPQHKLLMTLRTSALQDQEAREALYQAIISSVNLEGNYVILLGHDAYDVPYKTKDGQEDYDQGDQVFSYLVCAICPVKEGKAALGYFPKENVFRCAVSQTVAPPEVGFLFPAFDDRSANIYNALYYARRPDQLHPALIEALFGTEPLLSAPEQRDGFQSALLDALEDECDMEVVQAVHLQLGERLALHKEAKIPEPLALTSKEMAGILRTCGVSQERSEVFQEKCREQFGEDAALQVSNLMDTKRFTLTTPQATVSLPAEQCYLVEERIIDGKRYLLIPAEDGLELNGLPLRVRSSELVP